MKYAFVSDVHGNLESLERALALVDAGDAIACWRHGGVRRESQ